MKLNKYVESLKKYQIEYTIVPDQKRTIVVENTFGTTYKGQVVFPKSIFHFGKFNGEWPITFAINKKNEICYQPFFNIDDCGEVCIDGKDCKTLKEFIQNFYTQPFNVCGDTYSRSISKYFSPQETCDFYNLNIDRTNAVTKNFYENFGKIKLVPVNEDIF